MLGGLPRRVRRALRAMLIPTLLALAIPLLAAPARAASTGAATLRLLWSGPGVSQRVVPASALLAR